MTNLLLITLLLTSLLEVNVAIASTISDRETAVAFKQSSLQNKIKLRVTNPVIKIEKINDTAPLPPINRPSIRGKAFQRQKYAKVNNQPIINASK